MGKKYVGEFESIDNKRYKVEIEMDYGGGTTNLILGDAPFTTEMSGSEKQMYSPIKGSTATIQILVEDFYFDLYSESPIGTTVKLIDITNGGSNIVWSGYLTPQMFNQNFALGKDYVELNAVDALSAIEGIKYVASSKEVLSFEAIIKKIISNCDIRYMYVSDNVQLNSVNGTETILDKLFIEELNFFDKKSDNETDDDVCWVCGEVLSEICQYLGYVAIMIGQDLWLLDYDAIRKGYGYYYRYDIKNGGNPVRTSFIHTKKINGDDHFSNNASVSLDNVYNKVSVKADTYSFGDFNGESYADKNITDTDNNSFSTSYGGLYKDYIWAEVFPSDEDQSKAIDCWIDGHNDKYGYNLGGEHNYIDFVAMKFIKKTNSKFFLYDKNWDNVTSQYENLISYDKFGVLNGGMFVKYFTKNLDKTKTSDTSFVKTKWNEYYKNAKDDPNLSSKDYLDYCLERGGIHSISWTEAILLNNINAEIRPNESEWYKFPYYQIECEGSIVQGGENSAIIIQGNFYWHNVMGPNDKIDAYPMEFKDYKLDKPNWINPNEDMFIPASVQWGNKWWNGTEWQNTQCGFKLNWLASEYRDDEHNIKGEGSGQQIEQWKCQKTIMQPQPITNTVSWRFGTSEEGHLIPVPKDENLIGKPILTIYRPVTGRVWKSRKDYYNGDDNGKLSGDLDTKNGIRWPWYFCALIGLKFKPLMGDPSYSEVNDSDTIYTNLLENNTIEELSEINFKVHTYDGKVNSYGSVSTEGGSRYIDKLYNKALANQESSWYDSDDNLATNGMKQEEHLIYKLVNQYTTPSKILECELKMGTVQPYGVYTDTALTDSYIVDRISTDYRMGYNSIKLLEKK